MSCDFDPRYETDQVRMLELRMLRDLDIYPGDNRIQSMAVMEERRPEDELPPLPPVSHLELGRQEPLSFAFSDRRRDPFEGATNNVLVFDQPVVTDMQLLERVAKVVKQLVDEVDPTPLGFPWEDPDYRLVLKPPTAGLSERGIQIWWTDSQGRTRGPDGRICA